MTEEQPKKRSWVKIGCFGLVGIFGLLIAIAMIGNALMTPEERARYAAEREAENAQQEASERAAAEAAANAEIDSAEKVTAQQLLGAFAENEVATKAALEGRSVLITGTIEAIELDLMDEPVVLLATGEMFQSVRVNFEKKDIEATSALRKGQELTALCKKVTEVAGTPILDDCVIR